MPNQSQACGPLHALRLNRGLLQWTVFSLKLRLALFTEPRIFSGGPTSAHRSNASCLESIDPKQLCLLVRHRAACQGPRRLTKITERVLWSSAGRPDEQRATTSW